jgi:DNA polymerase-3 subunit delta'
MFVGATHQTSDYATTFMMKHFCEQKGCSSCRTCQQLAARQHHALMWLSPEKQVYSVDQIDEILHVLSFKLDEGSHYFVVLEMAELLSINAANRLLKIMEEPPPGYHFLLLTQSSHHIVPTIVSRCVIEVVEGAEDSSMWEEFLSLFKDADSDYGHFCRTFEMIAPTESQTRRLLDMLIEFWQSKHHHFVKQGNAEKARAAYELLEVFQDALDHQPMPGSAKAFWRTLFMEYKRVVGRD